MGLQAENPFSDGAASDSRQFHYIVLFRPNRCHKCVQNPNALMVFHFIWKGAFMTTIWTEKNYIMKLSTVGCGSVRERIFSLQPHWISWDSLYHMEMKYLLICALGCKFCSRSQKPIHCELRTVFQQTETSLILSYLRTSMGQERLSHLALYTVAKRRDSNKLMLMKLWINLQLLKPEKLTSFKFGLVQVEF